MRVSSAASAALGCRIAHVLRGQDTTAGRGLGRMATRPDKVLRLSIRSPSHLRCRRGGDGVLERRGRIDLGTAGNEAESS